MWVLLDLGCGGAGSFALCDMVHIERQCSAGNSFSDQDIFEGNNNLKLKMSKCRVSADYKETDSAGSSYFGIVAYFVQISELLFVGLELKELTNVEVQGSSNLVNIAVNIDISQVSYDMCPAFAFDMMKKSLFKMSFFASIYLMWSFLYFIMKLFGSFYHQDKSDLIRQTLILGLVEIIKYTYAGIASVTFMSLTCLQIGSQSVWKYDGNSDCFSAGQYFYIAFSIFYVIPFFSVLIFGLKALMLNYISPLNFLLGCIFPFPFLIYYLSLFLNNHSSKESLTATSLNDKMNSNFMADNKIAPSKAISASKEGIDQLASVKSPHCQKGELIQVARNIKDEKIHDAVIQAFTGPYKSGLPVYWESVLELRRLLFALILFIDEQILQIILSSILCVLILVHHCIVHPFAHQNSNRVETLSLTLLIAVSLINLIEATIRSTGGVIGISTIKILRKMLLIEKNDAIVYNLIHTIIKYVAKVYEKVLKQNWIIILPDKNFVICIERKIILISTAAAASHRV